MTTHDQHAPEKNSAPRQRADWAAARRARAPPAGRARPRARLACATCNEPVASRTARAASTGLRDCAARRSGTRARPVESCRRWPARRLRRRSRSCAAVAASSTASSCVCFSRACASVEIRARREFVRAKPVAGEDGHGARRRQATSSCGSRSCRETRRCSDNRPGPNADVMFTDGRRSARAMVTPASRTPTSASACLTGARSAGVGSPWAAWPSRAPRRTARAAAAWRRRDRRRARAGASARHLEQLTQTEIRDVAIGLATNDDGALVVARDLRAQQLELRLTAGVERELHLIEGRRGLRVGGLGNRHEPVAQRGVVERLRDVERELRLGGGRHQRPPSRASERPGSAAR